MLTVFAGIIYGLYYFFFVLNTGDLTIEGNVSDYEVSLFAQNIKTPFHSHCQQSHCELIELAPFSYEVTITAKGYKKTTFSIQIPQRDTLKVSFFLEKEMIIREVETQTWAIDATGSQMSQLDRLKSLSFLKHTYAYYDLEERGFYYFLDNYNETLSLYKKWEDGIIIAFFPKMTKKQMNMQKVYGTNDEIAIIFDETLYFYNTTNGHMSKTSLPAELVSIKKFPHSYGFSTASGMYLYHPETNKKESFPLFQDFLYYGKNAYIWLIKGEEKDKKKVFHLNDNSNDVIVKYELSTQKLVSSHEIFQKVAKLTQEGTGAYYYDLSGTKYSIENVE